MAASKASAAAADKKTIAAEERRKKLILIKNNRALYVMILLPIIYFILFKYIPMTNIVIAFKDYNIFAGTWASPWANPLGKYFIQAFSSAEFQRALWNTINLNVLDLVFSFPAPIIVAIMLNELTFKKFKRVTQTILYMPHFLSWIVIAGLAMQIFAPETGMVNVLLRHMGFESVPFLNDSGHWIATYVTLGVWQSAGWNTIIYLAAITGIDTELYEAAEVDGATRFRKIWHITLPGIRPTIVTLLILQMGRMLQVAFDRPYALANYLVMDVADVISTYVYRVGIESQQFALSTAVGVFQSVVCVIFLLVANVIAKRLGEDGIW